MASSATVSAPKKRKSFSEYFHSMRGQQLIVTLVFLFVPLVLLFMFTYLPIAVAALFTKVEWKPIHHSVTARELSLDLILILD